MFGRIRGSIALRLIPPFLLCTRSRAIHSRVDRPDSQKRDMTGVTLLGPLGRRSCSRNRSYSRYSRNSSHSRIAPFGLGTAPFRSSNVTGCREGPNIRDNTLPTATTALTGRRMRPCLSTVDAFCTEISTSSRSRIRALSCPIDYRFPSLIPQCLLRAASDTFRDINGCRMVTLPTRITCHRKCHFLEQ